MNACTRSLLGISGLQVWNGLALHPSHQLFLGGRPMPARPGITLYHSPASRAFTAYWMLEELGVPFSVTTVDIRKGEQKAPAYLKLNPAIAIYLADRYGYGRLAPRIEEADRGSYLKWMVYSSAVVDPVATLHEQKIDLPGFNFSFGAFEDMVGVL